MTIAAVSRGCFSWARVARRSTSTTRSAGVSPSVGRSSKRRCSARANSTWHAASKWSFDAKYR